MKWHFTIIILALTTMTGCGFLSPESSSVVSDTTSGIKNIYNEAIDETEMLERDVERLEQSKNILKGLFAYSQSENNCYPDSDSITINGLKLTPKGWVNASDKSSDTIYGSTISKDPLCLVENADCQAYGFFYSGSCDTYTVEFRFEHGVGELPAGPIILTPEGGYESKV